MNNSPKFLLRVGAQVEYAFKQDEADDRAAELARAHPGQEVEVFKATQVGWELQDTGRVFPGGDE